MLPSARSPGLLPLPPPGLVQGRPDGLQGLREFGLEQFLADAAEGLLGGEAIEAGAAVAPEKDTVLVIADQELAQIGQLRQVRQFVHLPAIVDSGPAHLLATTLTTSPPARRIDNLAMDMGSAKPICPGVESNRSSMHSQEATVASSPGPSPPNAAAPTQAR